MEKNSEFFLTAIRHGRNYLSLAADSPARRVVLTSSSRERLMQARPGKDKKKSLNDFIQTLFLLTKDFINVLSRRKTGFHGWEKLFEQSS